MHLEATHDEPETSGPRRMMDTRDIGEGKQKRIAGREIVRGDVLPWVYAGTLITQGQGIAQVQATGLHTEMGNIGKALQTIEPERSRLHQETGRLVRLFVIGGAILAALVVVLYGVTRGHWLSGILAGITVAMSLIPEEFPVVLTIFLALGAWRIAQRHVLTRRMPAIETLGAATVLCVDKTGPLTDKFDTHRDHRSGDGQGHVQAQ